MLLEQHTIPFGTVQQSLLERPQQSVLEWKRCFWDTLTIVSYNVSINCDISWIPKGVVYDVCAGLVQRGQVRDGVRHRPLLQVGYRPILQVDQCPLLQVSHCPLLQVGHCPLLQVGHCPLLQVGHCPLLQVSHRPLLQVGHLAPINQYLGLVMALPFRKYVRLYGYTVNGR